MSDIPSDVREFIFEHIDAVEHLDVLLFLRQHRGEEWTADRLGEALRMNPVSIAGRLKRLEASRLLVRSDAEPPRYLFQPDTPELAGVVERLAEAHRVRRHRVFEAIYSPMKVTRALAQAFRFKKREDDDV